MERLERAKDQISTLAKARNDMDRELATAYEANVGKSEDRQATLASSLDATNRELAASIEARQVDASMSQPRRHPCIFRAGRLPRNEVHRG